MLRKSAVALACLLLACGGEVLVFGSGPGAGGHGGSDTSPSGGAPNTSSSSSSSSASSSSSSSASSSSSSSSASSSSASSSSASSSSASSTSSTSTSSSSGGPYEELYASTSNALYKINPASHAMALVGTFVGCYGVQDLAMDGNGQLYGSSYQGLHKIDKNTGSCTTYAPGQKPTNLAVFPKGAVSSEGDVLVAFQSFTYLAYSKINSDEKLLGTFTGPGNSQPWGDLAWVPGLGAIVTAYGGVGGCNPPCVVQFDPTSGAMIKSFGSPGFWGLVGLAYYQGATYGFTYQGKVYELVFGANNVKAVEVVMNNPPPQLQWTGAAATLPLVSP